MKTRLSIVVLLTVIVLLIVVGNVSGQVSIVARRLSDGYTAYLPLVAKPPCTTHQVAAYLSASRPVITVGESITVTGAAVSDGCPLVGESPFYFDSSPTGILQPTLRIIGFGQSAPASPYREASATFTSIGTGPVTFTLMASAKTSDLPYNFVYSSPIVVRVLPSSP